MANEIFWGASADPTVVNYEIQVSIDSSGPWTVLTTVPGLTSGPNYIDGEFYYEDLVSAATIWYRIIAIDSDGDRSTPSVPFQANGQESASFTVGSTPFGIFDLDSHFQVDADRIVSYTRSKLGDPVMSVHLRRTQIYASFEEACLEYSAIVNSYQAKSVLTMFLGAPTGSLTGAQNTYPASNLEFEKRQAEAYGDAADLNSTRPSFSASIDLVEGLQQYDLQAHLTGVLAGITGTLGTHGSRIEIRELFHYNPVSAYRFFGQSSTLNYLHNQFNFESFTPDTVFYLLPIWEDMLRGMQFKLSNKIRRSNYGYELHNNVLTIYPVPAQNMRLWLRFSLPPNPSASSSASEEAKRVGVANLSNIPFGNIEYSKLNSIGKQWIRRFAFALAKETEGQIRGKMQSIPIPNGDLQLNGSELIQDARADQEALRAELKEMLDEMTYDKLAAKEAEKAASLENSLKQVPLGIYVF